MKNNYRDNYPAILFSKLYIENKMTDISVVNLGIDSDILFVRGLKRYEHDILDIKGIKYIMNPHILHHGQQEFILLKVLKLNFMIILSDK